MQRWNTSFQRISFNRGAIRPLVRLSWTSFDVASRKDGHVRPVRPTK
jgi:hypothetical protein